MKKFKKLLDSYDKSITPIQAKEKLSTLTLHKNTTLAKLVSQISDLSLRAAYVLPKEFRENQQNNESIYQLQRLLPTHSRNILNKCYTLLTQKHKRPPEFSELISELTPEELIIDEDIKNNAYVPDKNKKNNNKGKGAGVYAITLEDESKKFPKKNQDKKPWNNRNNSQNNSNSNSNSDSKPRFKPRNDSNSNNKKNNNNQNKQKKCQVCGIDDHITTDCKNMRNDQGKILEPIPDFHPCKRCPAYVYPRLRHPERYCPFRKGGVFAQNAPTKNNSNQKKHNSEGSNNQNKD